MKKIITVLLFVCMCLSLTACNGKKEAKYEDFEDTYVDSLPEDAQDGLTLHAFNWTYEQIRSHLKDIADAGFKNVLLMPVQQPKSSGSAWWAFYQPLSFFIGDKSPLGSKEELERLCAEAENYGICILADLVVNHMANDGDKAIETDGTPTVCPDVREYERILYDNRNEDLDGNGVTFHHNVKAGGTGSETQVYQWGNLPDLDTSNQYVQDRVLSLMKECIDAGIDGFRFDAAKHVETEQDKDYPSDFWSDTLDVAREYYREKTGKELYAYGEILATPTGRPLSYYTEHMLITDDGFVSSFKSCMAQKDPQLILNAPLKDPDPNNLIAWVESHDEYISGNTHYSEERVAKYWSVIAAKKDLGGLFFARPTSDLMVGRTGSMAFMKENVAAANRFHNRFYDAETFESAYDVYYVSEKIKDDDQGALIICVDEVDPDKKVSVNVPHLENGNYYDSLTGNKVVVTDGVASVQFDSNGVAILTRSSSVHPSLEVSDIETFFTGDKEITLNVKNAEEAAYWFNDESDRISFTDTATFNLKDHLKDGNVTLNVYARNGKNVIERSYEYQIIEVKENKFNVLGIGPEYLNEDYELYIWSWSPGRWSRDYEIEDGIILVDTTGMSGFLIAVFEKGYEVKDIENWDPNVIKQSSDISGELLEQGYVDLTGF